MRILVSGAGAAGLCAGIDLARAGHEVEIVERANHLRVNGSPIDVRAFLSFSPQGARTLKSSQQAVREQTVYDWKDHYTAVDEIEIGRASCRERVSTIV